MNFDQFIGQVQHRARLASSGEALEATRATLETLAERLASGEAQDLAAQLPRELARYLSKPSPDPHRYSRNEFLRRVGEREGVDLPKAIFHVRAVLDVLTDAVSAGEINDVRCQLPPEFAPLFDSGSEGQLARAGTPVKSKNQNSKSAMRKGIKGNPPSRQEPQQSQTPGRDEIALRAYYLYEQEGRPDGRALDHWLEAEVELNGNRGNRSGS